MSVIELEANVTDGLPLEVAHLAILSSAPCPVNIDVLSIFWNSLFVAIKTQSPAVQSVIPFKDVAPVVLTI